MKIKTLLGLAIILAMGIWGLSGCERTETYTVTFDANGGTGTMQQQLFTEGEQQALNRNAFTRDGYSFSGWNGNGVNYIDGQVITITTDMILYAQWTSNSGQQGGGSNGGSGGGGNQTGNQLNGHEYVDLGLPSGTKWATCNVGANIPSGTGYYYAWGETTPKSEYNSSTYTYSDTPTTLPTSVDAATVNWGSGWRMPTETEMQELVSTCNYSLSTQNNVQGSLFTGPNGNSIFLPAAGYRRNSELILNGGRYWTSSSLDENYASRLELDTEYGINCYVEEGGRALGYSVRPVCQP